MLPLLLQTPEQRHDQLRSPRHHPSTYPQSKPLCFVVFVSPVHRVKTAHSCSNSTPYACSGFFPVLVYEDDSPFDELFPIWSTCVEKLADEGVVLGVRRAVFVQWFPAVEDFLFVEGCHRAGFLLLSQYRRECYRVSDLADGFDVFEEDSGDRLETEAHRSTECVIGEPALNLNIMSLSDSLLQPRQNITPNNLPFMYPVHQAWKASIWRILL